MNEVHTDTNIKNCHIEKTLKITLKNNIYYDTNNVIITVTCLKKLIIQVYFLIFENVVCHLLA